MLCVNNYQLKCYRSKMTKKTTLFSILKTPHVWGKSGEFKSIWRAEEEPNAPQKLPPTSEVWNSFEEAVQSSGKLGLTRAQSKSTASSMSSWWPILDTPKSSSSWWVIRSSWSPPTFSLSKVLMYCCRQSSRPEGWQKNTFCASRQHEKCVFWQYQYSWYLMKHLLTLRVLIRLDIAFLARICAANPSNSSTGCIFLCLKCETVCVKPEIWQIPPP